MSESKEMEFDPSKEVLEAHAVAVVAAYKLKRDLPPPPPVHPTLRKVAEMVYGWKFNE